MVTDVIGCVASRAGAEALFTLKIHESKELNLSTIISDQFGYFIITKQCTCDMKTRSRY